MEEKTDWDQATKKTLDLLEVRGVRGRVAAGGTLGTSRLLSNRRERGVIAAISPRAIGLGVRRNTNRPVRLSSPPSAPVREHAASLRSRRP